MFIFTLEADTHYLFWVNASSDEVGKAMLAQTDISNVWIEYDIPNVGRICTLSGKEMCLQAQNVFKVLKTFEHYEIGETNKISGQNVVYQSYPLTRVLPIRTEKN